MLNHSSLANATGSVIDRLQASVVTVQDGDRGSGAGVLWRRGVVITNAHVARGSSVIVTFHDGDQEYDAPVIGRDADRDLVAVKVQSVLGPAMIGNSDNLRTGEMVIAIGHPLGVEGAATFGIVNRRPSAGKRQFITSSIYLNRGNSGGPLANAAGQVIGINTMVLTPGIGLAIPASSVEDFLRQVIEPEVRFGIIVQHIAVPESYVHEFGLSTPTGLLITTVEPGSIAEAAGLLPGDLILAINDRGMGNPEDLQAEINRRASNGGVVIEIMRGGEPMTLKTGMATMA